MYAGPSSSRPMTSRVTTHQNTGTTTTATPSSNYYYNISNNTRGPLPAELITRRPTSSYAANILPNGTSHSRASTGSGPFILQQSTTIRNEIKSNDNATVRIPTPLRAPTKSVETGLQQLDGFNFDSVTLDEHQKKYRVKTENKIIVIRFLSIYLIGT